MFQETPYSEWVDAGSLKTCADCHLDEHRFSVQLEGAVSISMQRLDPARLIVGVRSEVAGHDFPSGARFAHEAWLEVTSADGGLHAFELSDDLEPVNPLEATDVTLHALKPGEVRTFEVASAPGATARVLYGKHRRALLHWLTLEPAEPKVVSEARE